MRCQWDLNSLRWIQYPSALRFNPSTLFHLSAFKSPTDAPTQGLQHFPRLYLSDSSVTLAHSQLRYLKGAPNVSYSTE